MVWLTSTHDEPCRSCRRLYLICKYIVRTRAVAYPYNQRDRLRIGDVVGLTVTVVPSNNSWSPRAANLLAEVTAAPFNAHRSKRTHDL